MNNNKLGGKSEKAYRLTLRLFSIFHLASEWILIHTVNVPCHAINVLYSFTNCWWPSAFHLPLTQPPPINQCLWAHRKQPQVFCHLTSLSWWEVAHALSSLILLLRLPFKKFVFPLDLIRGCSIPLQSVWQLANTSFCRGSTDLKVLRNTSNICWQKYRISTCWAARLHRLNYKKLK